MTTSFRIFCIFLSVLVFYRLTIYRYDVTSMSTVVFLLNLMLSVIDPYERKHNHICFTCMYINALNPNNSREKVWNLNLTLMYVITSFSDEFSQIDVYQTYQLEWHYISMFVYEWFSKQYKMQWKRTNKICLAKKIYIYCLLDFQCTKYMAFLQTTKKVIWKYSGRGWRAFFNHEFYFY